MRLLRYVLISLLCLPVLVACGGGTGGVSASGSQAVAQASLDAGASNQEVGQQEVGQVTVLIGDSRLFGWDHVWITFAGVQFLTDDGQEIDALDAPRELDLLSLKHFTERLVPEMDVAVGTIVAVRFIISDIRLEKVDDLGATIAEYHPFGFGNVNVAVNNAEVESGKKLVIEFDFDLDRSIQASADGSEVDFHPVITSKTSNDDGVTPRLMRVEGDVDSAEGNNTKVCAIRSAAHDDDDDLQDPENCVLLVTNDATTYIDEANDGAPIILMPGDHLVAYGFMDMKATQDTVMAEVIAVGEEFVRLDGDALSEVTDGGFDLSVEVYVEEQPEQQGSDGEGGGWYSHDWPGHDCDWHDGVWNKLDWDRIDPGGCYGEGSDAADDPIEVGQAVRHVQLADGSKVFDAQPKEVRAEDIAVTNYLEAEGFPPTMDGDPDVNAFIVMLNHEVVVVAGVPTPTIVSESEERLIGEITSYGSGFVYVVTNANNAGDPWCVAYTSDTNIIEIYTDPDGVKVEQVLAPTIVGSQRFFDARGEMGSPCFDATSLVIDAVPFK